MWSQLLLAGKPCWVYLESYRCHSLLWLKLQTRLSQEVLREVELRQQTSSVIQLALLVLNSSRTTLPAARWYIHKVVEAFAKGLKFHVSLAKDDVQQCLPPKTMEPSFPTLDKLCSK